MTDPGINWSYKQKKYKVLNILVILLSEDSDRDDDYEDAEGATEVCSSSSMEKD